MRTIKFRGQREDTKEWVYGSLIEDKYIVGNVIDWNEDYFNTEYWWTVISETVGQFIGLYDNTQWGDLSEQERQEFYFKNCSDDGMTIKYKTQEEVKHLWKGREIYEGDILSIFDDMLVGDEPFEIIWKEYSWFWKDNKNDDCFMKHIAEMSTIVGDIHDNKELLE